LVLRQVSDPPSKRAQPCSNQRACRLLLRRISGEFKARRPQDPTKHWTARYVDPSYRFVY
jgi:hypothetical protein